MESGGSNPAADANGSLTITRGDRVPGVPANQVKLAVEVQATDKLAIGATAIGQSGMYLVGDEANLAPEMPGFLVLNLNASYQMTPHLQLFARGENVTNKTYYTYGSFSPTSSVYLVQAPDATNSRSYSPAAPFGGFVGVRLNF